MTQNNVHTIRLNELVCVFALLGMRGNGRITESHALSHARAQVVAPSDCEEVCIAVVHSILFSRVLGLIVPSEGHVQALDVFYVSVWFVRCSRLSSRSDRRRSSRW